ncbi:MAG: hypothetical protein ACOCZE_06350, partial [Planctomycetota bacterium]
MAKGAADAGSPPGRVGMGRSKGSPLLARGEPMIWLTGGAMWLSLAMIVALLALVVYEGFSTFWPQPVVRLELIDAPEFGGRVHMGEVTREEIHELSKSEYLQLSEPVRARLRSRFLPGVDIPADATPEALAQLDARIADDAFVEVRRRLVRTGNYDLTNEHFNWVPDYAIADGGQSQPEWALLLERTEWGRFYGFPQAFSLTSPRSPSQTETVLQEFAARAATLQGQLPEETWAQLETILQAAAERIESARRQQTAEFLSQFQTPEDPEARFVLVYPPFGDPVPLAQADPNQMQVDRVVQLWKGPQLAWQEHNAHHAAALERLEEARRIDRNQIGELNEVEEEARLEVRKAELDAEVTLLPIANRLADIAFGLDQLDNQVQQIRKTIDAAGEMLELSAPQRQVVDQAAQAIVAELQQEIAAAEATRQLAMNELNEILAESPEPDQTDKARQAVLHFAEIQILTRRRSAELTAEIDKIKAENQRYALEMETASGRHKTVHLAEIVRAYPANQVSDDFGAKM